MARGGQVFDDYIGAGLAGHGGALGRGFEDFGVSHIVRG